MTLSPGTRLGPYEITAPIGAGGMGEVYRAHDPRLGRDVAVKVLTAGHASDPERLRRFEREARAIAALNHPGIVTIYSVEQADGVPFITMELVEGKTLRELIPRDGLQAKALFELSIPLADALSAAHERGIVHRDLKPDNVVVGKDGRLKVLDFGLAKLRREAQALALSEVATRTQTAEGRIVGTVAYMSPEQAESKSLDHRSDLFSLGVLLHEMATGQRPFQGDTSASVLSAILKDTPKSVSDINPLLPREFSRIVRHCLVKDPEYRYQSAKDIRNELAELQHTIESGQIQEAAVLRSRRKRRLFPVAAAGLIGVIAGVVVVVWLLGAREETSASLRGVKFERITSQVGAELHPSLSPDGTFFVYAGDAKGNLDIYFQRVDGRSPMPLTDTCTDDDKTPVVSPDGRHIAFRSERDGGGIYLMGATGETVRRLTDFGYDPSWSPDSRQVAVATNYTVWSWASSGPSKIWIVDVESGNRHPLTDQDAKQPAWSPRGHRIAFKQRQHIYTIPAKGGDTIPVTGGDGNDVVPAWSPDGKHLYFSSDRAGSMNLWRVRVDERSGKVLSAPEPVTSGGTAERHSPSFSNDGRRLVYVEDETASNLEKVAFDEAKGAVVGLPSPITQGPYEKYLPEVSPDGAWVAYFRDFPTMDIAKVRPDGTGQQLLTDDRLSDLYPRWSPDGLRIAFHSSRSGSNEIWTIRPDGLGLRQLTDTPGVPKAFPTWSPRDSRMALVFQGERVSYIFDTALPWKQQTPGRLPPLGPGDDGFVAYSWSPDGRWLAGFARGEGWIPHGVVVYSLETEQYRTLTKSGGYPCWLFDSRRLLFWDDEAIYVVDSRTNDVHSVLKPAPGGARQGVSLSRDNRWLYYSHWTRAADVWMLTLADR